MKGEIQVKCFFDHHDALKECDTPSPGYVLSAKAMCKMYEDRTLEPLEVCGVCLPKVRFIASLMLEQPNALEPKPRRAQKTKRPAVVVTPRYNAEKPAEGAHPHAGLLENNGKTNPERK